MILGALERGWVRPFQPFLKTKCKSIYHLHMVTKLVSRLIQVKKTAYTKTAYHEENPTCFLRVLKTRRGFLKNGFFFSLFIAKTSDKVSNVF